MTAAEEPLQLIATTAFGLEAVVRRELESLGYDAQVIAPGWVQFAGDAAAICRANLWLRTADRVLIQQACFEARDFDALFETTRAIAWDTWLPRDASFPVVGRSIKSQLSSVPACQRAVKKAIVESLRTAYGTETLPETGPLYKIEIALLKDQATLTIDTTGPSLHKRGYRQRANEAPLKETLAAAMIQLSFWRRERPLIDPFCGSGTIPIEAALIGRNMAPGLHRDFAAERWTNLSAAHWSAARDEARALVEPPLEERIIGTDVDRRALASARDNAERAGVAESIHFQQKPFAELSSKRKYGCVITNPPYGLRLGDYKGLEPLYESMPEVLRGLPTWSHFILTAYPQFERLIQKQAARRRKLYNGRIECTFYQFHGPKEGAEVVEVDTAATTDEGGPAASPRNKEVIGPVFGGLGAKADEQAQLFRSRLQKRARHLRRWPTKRGITCFRLYERDIPEIPLVVDRYEDHLHITEYERPHDRDIAQHADWLDLMCRTAAETLDVDLKHVFFKSRRRQRGRRQHEAVSQQRYETVVHEGGLKFLVNLSDYIDTGLFLDHRITRSMVREEAAGANFLNLFGYTGAFTVYAADGGAARSTTVDLSGNYLQWAERNMSLNQFTDSNHRFVRQDAGEFLLAHPPGRQYDLAVVDPPTFSNSKRTDNAWDVQREYDTLLNDLLELMRPGGVIYFSTNFRRFKFHTEEINADEIHEISKQTVPEDFRNRRIHRCWRIVVGDE